MSLTDERKTILGWSLAAIKSCYDAAIFERQMNLKVENLPENQFSALAPVHLRGGWHLNPTRELGQWNEVITAERESNETKSCMPLAINFPFWCHSGDKAFTREALQSSGEEQNTWHAKGYEGTGISTNAWSNQDSNFENSICTRDQLFFFSKLNLASRSRLERCLSNFDSIDGASSTELTSFVWKSIRRESSRSALVDKHRFERFWYHNNAVLRYKQTWGH